MLEERSAGSNLSDDVKKSLPRSEKSEAITFCSVVEWSFDHS